MDDKRAPDFTVAEIGALAHLYRGELYRSVVGRTRLDTTTNWAVVTTGIALSLSYSSENASPLPLVVVGLLVAVFLSLESRRYRFFDFWRLRAYILELHFFGPILLGQGVRNDGNWGRILFEDYREPNLHISFLEAAGRRIRRNYAWIFSIQAGAYLGKLLIHPDALASWGQLWSRAAIGPVPGQVVLLCGLAFHSVWVGIALSTLRGRRGAGRARPPKPAIDPLLALARTPPMGSPPAPPVRTPE